MTGAGAVLDGCATAAAATGLLTVESAVMTNDRISGFVQMQCVSKLD